MSVNGIDSSSTTTSRGTPIVKKGSEMDKNAFLKILSAELSNQDPTNATDGTQYVAQMAQFSSLEQMANLNSTMKFSGMTGLIGSAVVLNSYDKNGNLYSGLVKSVYRDGDNVNIDVAVGKEKDSDGNIVDAIQEFDSDDVIGVENDPQNDVTQNSTDLLNAAHLIGNTVVLSDVDENKVPYQGIVKGIHKDSQGIKVSVLYDAENNKTEDFPIDDITSIKES